MSDTHFAIYAVDSFDNRIAPEDREAFVASRPHEDAVFDWMWVSRNGGKLSDGWRFAYACDNHPGDCPDAIGDMPVSRGPDGHPKECPDCGGRVFWLARSWDVSLATKPAGQAAEGDRA